MRNLYYINRIGQILTIGKGEYDFSEANKFYKILDKLSDEEIVTVYKALTSTVENFIK